MAQVPDKAEARDQSRPFPLHPKVDLEPARIVDVINLGMEVQRFPGDDDYVAERVVLVFYTGQKDVHGSGKVVHVEQRYTLSMGKKSRLRRDVESWRGDAFTPEEERVLKKEGFDVTKLYGKPCLVSTTHKTSAAGRTRCEVLAIAKVPERDRAAVPRMEDIDYTRNPWWEDEKKRILEDTTEWFRKNGGGPKAAPVEVASAQENDDDLPF